MNQEDSLKEVCVCLAAVVAVLAVLGIVPGWEAGGIKVKQVNIFSDLRVDTVSDRGIAAAVSDADSVPAAKGPVPDSVVRIEDFSADTAMWRFCGLLNGGKWKERPVRIAFLGDSYIEADIITEDLREWLQCTYGGRGVGFVPVYSQAGGYRLTVEQRAENWKSYSMVYHDKADWKKLMVSGEYFVPQENAVFSVKTTSVRGADRFGEARFFFQNSGRTRISVRVNDSRDTLFVPTTCDSLLQDICLRGDMRQLDFRFSEPEGFTAFGVFLNDRKGVYVDNFSLRGSSGIVLSIMNRELMEQLRRTVAYDLVVLGFGLNVVLPDARGYTSYRQQMVKAINHLKACFPGAVFLLTSVSDRAYRNADGSFGTREGVLKLVEEQRRIAEESGIAFWNLFQAMGGRDAMVRFVKQEPSLGNKDYTHINHLGGRKIAGELIKALEWEVKLQNERR